MNPRRGIPLWVWTVSILLAAIVPLAHFWIWYFPKPGTVPTGLISVDGVSFIHFMRMFRTGFYSPFASCHAPHGAHYFGYFVSPVQWLYGVIGYVGAWFGGNDFLVLGVASGLATLSYLLAVYLFLREVFPAQAPVAFLLFAMGGGPTGLIFIVTGLLGLHDSPLFADSFMRFTFALLQGGQNLRPMRLYYTLPLAASMMGLVSLVRGIRWGTPWRLAAAGLWLGLGAFINLRIGVMAWPIAMLYLYLGCPASATTRTRRQGAVIITVALALAEGAGWAFTTLNKAQVQNILHNLAVTMDLSSFYIEFIFFLPWILLELRRVLPHLPRPARIAGYAALGYLALFTVLYCAYQTYYGNWVVSRNYAVTLAVSDWALWGAGLGAVYGYRRRTSGQCPADATTNGWVALWLLFFLCGAVGAVWHGWIMRLTPLRLAVLLGLPACILTASSLHRVRETAPRLRRTTLSILFTGGITSTAVAGLFFIGPLEWSPAREPFESVHWMSERNAHVLDHVQKGRVLTPFLMRSHFSDALSLRADIQVVLGTGSGGMSDVNYMDLWGKVDRFFLEATPDVFRTDFIREWCVDYVFLPEADGVSQGLAGHLRLVPWLELVAEEGQAVLFRVSPDRLPVTPPNPNPSSSAVMRAPSSQ